MRENSIAKRYASALVKSLKDEREYKAVKKELEEFLNLLEQNADFKSGMETMLFSQGQKKELLNSINEKIEFKSKTVNFLLSLVDENRIMILDSIIYVLENLWLEKNGIEKLKVFSAVAMSKKMEAQLVEKLEHSFDKKIVIEKEIDPALLAGIKIQRGSVYYDFSVEGNLKKLKEALLTDIESSATVRER